MTEALAAADTRSVGTKTTKVRSSRTPVRKRVSLAAVVAEVESSKRPRRVPGRNVAVVPLADLRRLRKLEREAEDRDDVAAARAALADPARIPHEQVRRELDLDRV